MRAAVIRRLGGPEVVEVQTVAAPAVQPGEVKVDVRATSLNFRDVRSRLVASVDTSFPCVPGSDFSGVVNEVGPGVDTDMIGKRVVGIAFRGAHAEQVVTLRELVTPIPDDFAFADAAALPTAGLSASFLLDVAHVDAGSTVVTYAAAGGLGAYLGVLLAAVGARSIGITSTATKAEVALAAGYQQVVVHRDRDPIEAVAELTDGRGADVVFDAVAGPEFSRRFALLAHGGTLVVTGRAAGEPDLSQAQDALFGDRRNLAVRDFTLVSHLVHGLDEFSVRIGHVIETVRHGSARVPLALRPLDEAPSAHKEMEAGETVGKIVFVL